MFSVPISIEEILSSLHEETEKSAQAGNKQDTCGISREHTANDGCH